MVWTGRRASATATVSCDGDPRDAAEGLPRCDADPRQRHMLWQCHPHAQLSDAVPRQRPFRAWKQLPIDAAVPMLVDGPTQSCIIGCGPASAAMQMQPRDVRHVHGSSREELCECQPSIQLLEVLLKFLLAMAGCYVTNMLMPVHSYLHLVSASLGIRSVAFAARQQTKQSVCQLCEVCRSCGYCCSCPQTSS